ncbi:hypothetical protein PHJA_001282700 [Phtheirospermum japonicum]|uniref:Uncharacterized protein n=1 Tax=Phtheirospermum japonicum TaxID=374723 RepID=A0A830BTU4_9LAMI|nr:hypothetical protein PHJA_001282700 [Phtheirospermum japonicum]
MEHPRIILARQCIFFLIVLLSTSQSQAQTNIPSAGLLCISDCESCPVICSSPPTSAPPSPKLPPPAPPAQHHSPPLPYYFDSPAPSSSPPLPPYPPPPPPPPPPPAYVYSGGGAATPPPPSVYVYNPGTNTGPPTSGQRNVSFPYYYFYASKASCYVPLDHQGFILLLLLNFVTSFLSYGFN